MQPSQFNHCRGLTYHEVVFIAQRLAQRRYRFFLRKLPQPAHPVQFLFDLASHLSSLWPTNGWCILSASRRSTFTQFATLFFAAGLASYGQNLFGTLTGTVLDQSGSAVPKAAVVITNTGTSQRWELAANEIGSFTLASIPPGSYAVKVSATGFRSFNQDRVVVQANATVRVEFHLEVGAVSESVEVNAAAVALQTDTMDVRNEIRATDLQNTPVPVSRNYQNLL
ncbi:MAG: carboxypeptidase regulatory-like domain-containing protein, partial [Acidobacteria bacterium]|nr:carboxypeptidase regulatory-like domain-containing protein [Acidobacteriota bacterium]